MCVLWLSRRPTLELFIFPIKNIYWQWFVWLEIARTDSQVLRKRLRCYMHSWSSKKERFYLWMAEIDRLHNAQETDFSSGCTYLIRVKSIISTQYHMVFDAKVNYMDAEAFRRIIPRLYFPSTTSKQWYWLSFVRIISKISRDIDFSQAWIGK